MGLSHEHLKELVNEMQHKKERFRCSWFSEFSNHDMYNLTSRWQSTAEDHSSEQNKAS